MHLRLGRILLGALLAALVACHMPVPGLDPGSPGNPSAGGAPVAGQPATVPGVMAITRLEPDNGGPGAVVKIAGHLLTGSGTTVRFGQVPATAVTQLEDGTLAVVVPEGAKTDDVVVTRGDLRAAKRFWVIGQLQVTLLKPLPAAVGLPLPVAVTAQDTGGIRIDTPSYQLSVDPPGAADVVTPTVVVPRSERSFRIQAFSGTVQAAIPAIGCSTGFSLATFAGDGKILQFYKSYPLLSQAATYDPNVTTQDPEPGSADTAHLSKPWGVLAFRHPQWGDGVLIADSLAGRVRFVPQSGTWIKTVVGGGGTPASTESIPATDAELNEPAGMATGRDWDGQDVVIIVERGRNRILRWAPGAVPPGTVQVIAGNGFPSTTRNGTDSVVAQDLGDRNDAKKNCGEPTKATFADPAGVALINLNDNARSIVFVADTFNHRIRRIVRLSHAAAEADARNRGCTISGGDYITGEISTILGSGKPGSDINSTDPASTSIDAPLDVAIHPDGVNKNFKALYVADTNNNRVLEVVGALDLANFGVKAVVPPVGSNLAPLDHPSGLYYNPGTHNLLISDTLRNRVLRFSPQGAVLKDIATCSLSASPSAGLVWPRGLSSRDTTRDFPAYVGDYFSNQVRVLNSDQ